MKQILTRLVLAAALMLAAFVAMSTVQAQQPGDQQPSTQQPDEDRAPASPRPKQPQASEKSPEQQQEAPKPSERNASGEANDEQTQEALAFTGRLQEEKGVLMLNDPVAKMSYRLDDPSKARPYLGKQVKIVGKLAMRSNTIHIDSIEPVP